MRKKFNPFLIVGIVIFTLILSSLIFVTEGFSIANFVGIGLITLASIFIAIFSQVIKIPLDEFAYDKSSVVFLTIVKERLNQSKQMLILGLLLQSLCLGFGLYFLIFYQATDVNPVYFYMFLGWMFALPAAGIGFGLLFFNIHYKPTYQAINQFLNN